MYAVSQKLVLIFVIVQKQGQHSPKCILMLPIQILSFWLICHHHQWTANRLMIGNLTLVGHIRF